MQTEVEPPLHRRSQGLEIPKAYQNAIAGIAGGSLAVLVCQPLDVVKTRSQIYRITGAYGLDASQWRSGIRAASIITKAEGVTALYQGVMPALGGGAACWAAYFHCYHYFKDKQAARSTSAARVGAPGSGERRAATDLVANLGAAVAAGVLVSLVSHPIWLVKTRLELQVRQHPSPAASRHGEQLSCRSVGGSWAPPIHRPRHLFRGSSGAYGL